MIFNKINFKYLIMTFGYLMSFQLCAEYFPIAHHTTALSNTDKKHNRPKSMEDAHFPKINAQSKGLDKPYQLKNGSFIYGVFDGHKSDRASKYCAQFFPLLLNEHCITQNLTEPLQSTFQIINENYRTSFEEKTERSCCDCWYNCINWFANCCCCNSNKVHPETIPDDGTTALIALITPQQNLWVANAGDSRAVLSKQGQAIRVSFDHKPYEESELNRLKQIASQLNLNPLTLLKEIQNPEPGSGGLFTCNILHDVNPLTGFENVQQEMTPAYKLLGQIGVCRAIGDYKYNPYITCEPFISCNHLTGNEEFLILACDGFWDVVSDKAAVNLILYHLAGLKKTKESLFRTEGGHAEIAEILSSILATKALALGSQDNITITVILFPAALTVKALTTDYRDSSGESIANEELIHSRAPSLAPRGSSPVIDPNFRLDEARRIADRRESSAFAFDANGNRVNLDDEEFH